MINTHLNMTRAGLIVLIQLSPVTLIFLQSHITSFTLNQIVPVYKSSIFFLSTALWLRTQVDLLTYRGHLQGHR